jgi:hypothetical protein
VTGVAAVIIALGREAHRGPGTRGGSSDDRARVPRATPAVAAATVALPATRWCHSRCPPASRAKAVARPGRPHRGIGDLDGGFGAQRTLTLTFKDDCWTGRRRGPWWQPSCSSGASRARSRGRPLHADARNAGEWTSPSTDARSLRSAGRVRSCGIFWSARCNYPGVSRSPRPPHRERARPRLILGFLDPQAPTGRARLRLIWGSRSPRPPPGKRISRSDPSPTPT